MPSWRARRASRVTSSRPSPRCLGIVRQVPHQAPGERVRQEYRPTRKGVEPLPLLLALKAWGRDEHLCGGVQAVRITDRETGEPVRLEFRTPSGKPVQPDQFVVEELTSGGPQPADVGSGAVPA